MVSGLQTQVRNWIWLHKRLWREAVVEIRTGLKHDMPVIISFLSRLLVTLLFFIPELSGGAK